MSTVAAFVSETSESAALVERYEDSYRAAATEIASGEAVRRAGIVLGGVVLIAGLVQFLLNPAEHHGFPVGFALFVACAVLLLLVAQVLGTVIQGQGQMLKAAVDFDVNSSPFLTNSERARAMTLKNFPVTMERVRVKAA